MPHQILDFRLETSPTVRAYASDFRSPGLRCFVLVAQAKQYKRLDMRQRLLVVSSGGCEQP